MGNVYTRYCSGYCLFLRSPVHNHHHRTPQRPSDADTGEAQVQWLQLLHSCHLVEASPLLATDGTDPARVPSLAPFLERNAASGSTMPVGSLPPPALRAPPGTAQGSSSLTAQYRELSDDGGLLMPLFPSATPMGSVVWGTPPHTGASSVRSSASATPHINGRHAALMMRASYDAQRLGGGFGALDGVQARSGESDRDFASRLAAIALSTGGGHASGLPYARPRPSGIMTSSSSGAVSASGYGSSSGGGSALGSNTTGYSSSAGGASGSGDDCCCGASAVPSAPPMVMPAVIPQRAAPEATDADACVICLSSSAVAGFLHGATVHRCVCVACSKRIKAGDRCPMCREKVERVLGIF